MLTQLVIDMTNVIHQYGLVNEGPSDHDKTVNVDGVVFHMNYYTTPIRT
jgi:hypothetical protein